MAEIRFTQYLKKMDNRPLANIARDFVKELADDSIRFISTLLK